MIREFGENTPKGKVYAINPAMIIILVPIITAAMSLVDPLVMIHYGTYVSALSVFFLAFSTSLWACVMFVFTLSIGECIWNPRLYDYTTNIAREGREGTWHSVRLPFSWLNCPSDYSVGYCYRNIVLRHWRRARYGIEKPCG
jgi:hypothetical protein